ncbi:MAG: universal stress protein, partial [Burkholderiaceae bacterium]
MFKRILVPTDGSDITAKATQTAIALARLHGAELFAISVKEPFPYSAISEMQPVPPQEFYDAQERIAASRVKVVVE